MSRRNQSVINEEVTFAEHEELVSTTDTRGIITYANDIFCQVAGFEEHELIGKNHNIVRHPDMPKAAFKDLWDHLKEGKNWRGAVKNRCKDGRYYWVDAYVTPIYEGGTLVGYQSVRVKLDEKLKQTAEGAYKAINQGKRIESPWVNLNTRHIAFVVANILLMLATFSSSWAALGFIVLPFIFYHYELLQTPAFLEQLKKENDSACRWVYSGTAPHSIADFHLKLNDGRKRTILGRIVDSTTQLEAGVTTLNRAAQSAKQGVENETHELHQVATAIEEMVATIEEVARNTASTSEKVGVAHSDCERATGAMTHTMEQVQHLADEVATSANSANELASEAEKIGAIMVEI
jgi:aerotaxis receptor